MLKGVGLILLGFAIFALSRPYMEMASGGDVPPPPPRWAPFRYKALHYTRRSGAVVRIGIGQIIGAAGMLVGAAIVIAQS